MRVVTTTALALGAVVAAPGSASAGSGVSGPITVTIDDTTLTGYACTDVPVVVGSTVREPFGWTVGVVAGPTGSPQSASTALAGRGPGRLTGAMRVCPSAGDGAWTARVETRVFLDFATFDVSFTVSRLPTTARILRARGSQSSTRVTGTVRAVNGIDGRGVIEVRGRWKGRWRVLGHTVVRPKGTFRLVSPRKARALQVRYLGDAVTQPSASRVDVRRRGVSTSSSP